MDIEFSNGAEVVIVCGETLPHVALGSNSFWASNRLTLVRCSEDPASVLSLCTKLHPSLLVAKQGLVDSFSDKNIAEITCAAKPARILVILNQDTPEAINLMLRRGCHGVLPSRFPAKVLRRVVPAICAGEIWAPRRVISDMLSELLKTRTGKRENRLTPREEHILDLVARGYKNSEIAAALFISQETVRWHKRRLHRKIDGARTSATKVQTRRMPPSSHVLIVPASNREVR